jgi:hypothetical protein
MAPITEDLQTKRLVTEILPFGEGPRGQPLIVVALETIREIHVIRGSFASFRLSGNQQPERSKQRAEDRPKKHTIANTRRNRASGIFAGVL